MFLSIYSKRRKLRILSHKIFNWQTRGFENPGKRVTLSLDKCSQAAVLIFTLNDIYKGQIFWAMSVSVLVRNQRGNRLVSGLEYHNFCADGSWSFRFQVI